MADNTIKDFVKRQTTPLTIGVPKQKAAEAPAPAPVPAEPAKPIVDKDIMDINIDTAAKAHVGRPKSDIDKVKLSIYLPADAKDKLVRIQHQNYKSSMNDVLMEAVNDIIKKYEKDW